jgi:ParB family chromosome partitioning protein
MDDTDEFNVVVMPKRSLQSGSSLLALLKGGSESTEEQMSFDGTEGEREFAPEEHSPERSIELLPLESISYNPHQTREIEEEADLAELAASIALKGVLQPILVRPTPEGETPYELVAGERRLRASRLAGMSEVPAIVQEMNDQESVEISIIENAGFF